MLRHRLDRPLANPALPQVQPAHPGLGAEGNEQCPGSPTSRPRSPWRSLASTTMERPSGVSSARLASWAASASIRHGHAGRREELGGHAVAERDGAGLVEEQRVHVARGLHRATAHGEDVLAEQPVHPGDADGREQPADGGGDEADQQRHDGRRREPDARVAGHGDERHAGEEEDQGQARPAGCAARSRWASSGATAPSTSAIIRSRKDSPGSTRDPDHDPIGEDPGSAGDGRAVAAGLADHRSRLAGDGRLVDRGDPLDDVPVAGDHLAGLAPPPGRPCRSAEAGTSSSCPPDELAGRHLLRIRRSDSAWALPRPSATASAKLAKTTVNHSHMLTESVNQPGAALRRVGDAVAQPEQRGEDAAHLDHEHDRVLRHQPRVELAQALERPPAEGGRDRKARASSIRFGHV